MSKIVHLNQDIAETLAKSSPAKLEELLKEAERQMQEEMVGTNYNPEKKQAFELVIQKIKQLLTPYDGEITVITSPDAKGMRHYIDVTIPTGTMLEGSEWGAFCDALKEFNFCYFQTEDEVTLNLSFEGIWK